MGRTALGEAIPLLIKIHHHQFSVAEPFCEGHALSAAEAQALNGLRAENIRNSLAKWIKRRLTSAIRPLSQEELAQAKARCAELDEEYEFAQRETRGISPGTLEYEMVLLAQEKVEAQARARGLALTAEQKDEAIAALVQDPSIRAEASRRMEVRSRVISQEAANLLAGLE